MLAALGIYHVAPGVDAWELSSPAFPRMVVHEGSRRLEIDTPGASKLEPYVHGVRLNRAPLERTFLTTCQLRAGGMLSFSLGASADRAWGAGAGAAPPSASDPSPAVDKCAASLAAGTS